MANPLGGFSVGQFIKQFGQNLWAELQTVLSAVGTWAAHFFDFWSETTDDVQSIVDDVHTLEENFKVEVQKLKDFEFDPKWKTRVINVPIAKEQIVEFVQEITTDLFDKVKEVIQPLTDTVHQWQADKITLQNQIDKPTALAVGSVKLKDIQVTIHLVAQAMHAAVELEQMFIDITDKIKGLDSVFLQQGNTRVRLKKTISARRGKLHAAA